MHMLVLLQLVMWPCFRSREVFSQWKTLNISRTVTVRNTISVMTIRESRVADQTAMSVVNLSDHMTQFLGINPISTSENIGYPIILVQFIAQLHRLIWFVMAIYLRRMFASCKLNGISFVTKTTKFSFYNWTCQCFKCHCCYKLVPTSSWRHSALGLLNLQLFAKKRHLRQYNCQSVSILVITGPISTFLMNFNIKLFCQRLDAALILNPVEPHCIIRQHWIVLKNSQRLNPSSL